MLNLTKGNTSQNIVVTLNEKKTLSEPYYLFVFMNVTTREKVKFIKGTMSDLSESLSRYNEFNINTSTLFDTYNDGEWNYTVYEQESAVNLDEDSTTGIVEIGKMTLNKATETTPTMYNNPSSYKAYNG
jgi:hypothetical protein